MKQRIKRTDSVKLDTHMVRAFIDSFWMHEKNPEVIREFWDTHKTRLMAFWTEGKSLQIDDYLIQNFALEDRLFTRPELWFIFEAKEPKLHYMQYFEPFATEALKQLHSECVTEATSDYLHRCGLLSPFERATTKPDPDSDYTLVEIQSDQLTNDYNNAHCSCWKSRLDKLDWQEKLNEAYRL